MSSDLDRLRNHQPEVPGPGEHWWCPACGTFDGPHHEGLCDVCADGTGIDGLVPRAEVERLRGELEDARDGWGEDEDYVRVKRQRDAAEAEVERLREDYKRELYEQAKQKSEAVAEIERLRGALRRYGEHDSACGVRLRRACTCGLAELRTPDDREGRMHPAVPPATPGLGRPEHQGKRR